MNPGEISRIAHTGLDLAGPYDRATVDDVLAAVDLRSASLVVDVGCGKGEWLLRALERWPRATGIGIDVSVEEAETRAAGRSERSRLRLLEADAAEVTLDAPADVVICVGSTHALGGPEKALSRLRSMLAPTGRLILGEGFWQSPPSEAARAVFAGYSDELPAGEVALIDSIEAASFHFRRRFLSSRQQWDDYEAAWSGALERWAREHPDDPGRDQALEVAARHRREYLEGYRGFLGFMIVVCSRNA